MLAHYNQFVTADGQQTAMFRSLSIVLLSAESGREFIWPQKG